MDAKTCGYIGGTWNPERKDCSVYRVTVDDIQMLAMDRINRRLTESELFNARKGVESGLGNGLDIVLETAIQEAVER